MVSAKRLRLGRMQAEKRADVLLRTYAALLVYRESRQAANTGFMADGSHRISHLRSMFKPDQDFQESKWEEMERGVGEIKTKNYISIW